MVFHNSGQKQSFSKFCMSLPKDVTELNSVCRLVLKNNPNFALFFFCMGIIFTLKYKWCPVNDVYCKCHGRKFWTLEIRNGGGNLVGFEMTTKIVTNVYTIYNLYG